MTPLMVKGVLFGLLLLSAAVWDMRNREIPNLIPALLLLCGLIGFRPAASVAGLFLVGGPFLLAAVLIKRDGFAIGGGDVKLMAVCGLLLGWKLIIFAFLLGCIIGSVIHLIRMKVSGEGHVLAMGPYLSVGVAVAVLWGNEFLQWYLGLYH